MSNSHPGWKKPLAERAFRDRDFDLKFWQEQGDEAMRMSESAEEIWCSHGIGQDHS